MPDVNLTLLDPGRLALYQPAFVTLAQELNLHRAHPQLALPEAQLTAH